MLRDWVPVNFRTLALLFKRNNSNEFTFTATNVRTVNYLLLERSHIGANAMDKISDLDAVADVVLAAHAIIDENGTELMKILSRMLLLNVGREIARRSITSEEQEIHQEEAMNILRRLLEKGS